MLRRGGLGLSIGLVLLGCGGVVDMASDRASEAIEEELAEQMVGLALGADVEQNEDGSLTITGDGLRLQTGGAKELPDGFPFPVPAVLEVLSVSTVEQDGARATMVIYKAPPGKGPFVEDIETHLLANGWTEEAKSTIDMGAAEISTYMANKGEETIMVQFQATDAESGGMWTWNTPLP